jgi:DtxR family Mn-dependent transcriptional regulator
VASPTIENYVKTIYQVCAQQENRPAATGQVAESLGVLPGTVTSMLKSLAAADLVTYTPYEGVCLTESGRTLALRVVRRHRLIELFLVETLQLSWDQVHDEAENMEHAVSDLLVDRIDSFLGYPRADPHGDPIPRSDGSMIASSGASLSTWEEGRPFRLIRVLDQTPKFLRYLSEAGLSLEAVGTVVAHRPEAGIVTICVAERETTLGEEAAEKLMVACPNGEGSG